MASLPSPIDIERIEASQYVSAVGLVVLLWDHVLTFSDEVELIWKARLSIAKVLFLFNRYAVPMAMIVQSHEFSGITPYLSLPFCKVWYAIAVAVGMLSIATSNFLILLRLWVLWDRCQRLVMGTLVFFIATQLTALSLAGYVIKHMLPTLIFDPGMRICMPMSKPPFILLWSPGMAFELMIFLTTVWNALDRPRCRDAKMAKIMYRDGSVYFFGLFALRVVNMLLSVVAPPSLVFLGVFFIWSVTNVTLARLILNLRRECNRVLNKSNRKATLALDEDPDQDEYKDGVERTELPVLRREISNRSCPGLRDKGVL